MQFCPQCNETYSDDVLECPNDGAPLQRPPEELQKNPKIEDVVQVTTNEMTAVVDLEKLEALRLKDEAQKKAAKAALDPEATGTFFRAEEAQTQSSSLENDVSSRLFSEEHSAVTQVNEPEIYSEPTEISLPNLRVENNPTDSEEQKSTDNSVLKYKVTIGIAGFICLAGLFLFFNPKPSEGSDATLLITTVPTGAEVWVDSQLKGKSPIQLPLTVGFYDLEIKQKGFHPYRDVIELTVRGLTISQALTPLTETKPSKLRTADQLVESTHRSLRDKDLTAAYGNVKEFIRRFPDDPRGISLLTEIGIQQAAQHAAPNGKEKTIDERRARKRPESWNTRLRQAELLVEQKKYGDAKQILSTLLREQPRRTRPHRLLARVAIGQNDATTTRYHLQRYLILGGADLDGQIKKWLQENPQK